MDLIPWECANRDLTPGRLGLPSSSLMGHMQTPLCQFLHACHRKLCDVMRQTFNECVIECQLVKLRDDLPGTIIEDALPDDANGAEHGLGVCQGMGARKLAYDGLQPLMEGAKHTLDHQAQFLGRLNNLSCRQLSMLYWPVVIQEPKQKGPTE